MRIELKKFGRVLISRPDGREAYLAAQAYVLPKKDIPEKIEVDFVGVLVLGPSWADEFLTPLKEKYGERVIFENSENASVKATLETIFSED